MEFLMCEKKKKKKTLKPASLGQDMIIRQVNIMVLFVKLYLALVRSGVS